ncbi:hypothetical protein PZE06_23045, partial [Robertmurraya sp. DFI.2.37]|uniref:hypothetical protein n=1 Tax=Robertmurraya sp. DFI.2.37 TaxID=3031819 RepID=UPI0023DB4F6F
VCLELPSDSTSPWTPLLSAMYLPLPGRTRDFHPLEFAHAGRTKKGRRKIAFPSLFIYSDTLFLGANIK